MANSIKKLKSFWIHAKASHSKSPTIERKNFQKVLIGLSVGFLAFVESRKKLSKDSFWLKVGKVQNKANHLQKHSDSDLQSLMDGLIGRHQVKKSWVEKRFFLLSPPINKICVKKTPSVNSSVQLNLTMWNLIVNLKQHT